jgi:hypothetical protein
MLCQSRQHGLSNWHVEVPASPRNQKIGFRQRRTVSSQIPSCVWAFISISAGVSGNIPAGRLLPMLCIPANPRQMWQLFCRRRETYMKRKQVILQRELSVKLSVEMPAQGLESSEK